MADSRTKRQRTRGDAEREALREYEEDERALDAEMADTLADIDGGLYGVEWDDPEDWPDWDDPEDDFHGCGCDDCEGVCPDCGLELCRCEYLEWHHEIA